MKNKLTEIIKEEGLGRYRKEFSENGGYISRLYLGLTNERKYCVISNTPYIKNFSKFFYEGYNIEEAEKIFNKKLEEDKNMKDDLINSIFSKN